MSGLVEDDEDDGDGDGLGEAEIGLSRLPRKIVDLVALARLPLSGLRIL